MGIISVIGRIGTLFVGIIGVPALQWMDGRALYLIFAVLSLISYVCMILMP
jgi:hypothetical protein